MSIDETTVRLGLPLLQSGQAQKEIDHNEALVRLDLATQASVAGVGIDAPPAAPAPGECWIVGTAPVRAWSGHAAALAGWTAGGWRFLAPVEGAAVWDRPSGTVARFVGGAWQRGVVSAARIVVGGTQVVGAQRGAIATPAGGSAPDVEARSAIAAILAVLREHGLIATS